MIIFVSIFLNLRIRDRCFVPVTAFVLCRHADQMPDEIREAHRREASSSAPRLSAAEVAQLRAESNCCKAGKTRFGSCSVDQIDPLNT